MNEGKGTTDALNAESGGKIDFAGVTVNSGALAGSSDLVSQPVANLAAIMKRGGTADYPEKHFDDKVKKWTALLWSPATTNNGACFLILLLMHFDKIQYIFILYDAPFKVFTKDRRLLSLLYYLS